MQQKKRGRNSGLARDFLLESVWADGPATQMARRDAGRALKFTRLLAWVNKVTKKGGVGLETRAMTNKRCIIHAGRLFRLVSAI